MDLSGSPAGGDRGKIARLLSLVAIVGLAYYAGGLVGLQLRMPSVTPSVLWPPNAILSAALIVTPVKRWPLVLAAALPGHLIAELQTDWPRALIAALFVTNCSEALLAAGGVCLFSDAPGRLDTLHRLAVFLLAAMLVAPLLSTFADAAAVAIFRHEPYWLVWRNRLISNVLAELVLVPAIAGSVLGAPVWLRQASRGRKIEAVVLAVALIISAPLTLLTPEGTVLAALWAEASLALQLPFVLWAAMRFGPTGTSLTLLVTTALTSWAVVHGHGPFRAFQPGVQMVALQLTLIVVSVTLLSLATVIEERRKTELALSARLRFEELLSRVSAAFVEVPSDRMEAAFASWLARLGTFLEIQCVRLYRTIEEGDLAVVAGWVDTESREKLSSTVRRDYPEAYRRLVGDQHPVVIPDVRALPIHSPDRVSLERLGYRSLIALPLVSADRPIGAMAFGSIVVRRWPEDVVTHLRLLSEVFANALLRKQTEDALRANELMKTAILESLTSGVAVIDRAGRVRAVNETWSRMMRESEGPSYPAVHVGDNLLESFRTAAARGNPRLMDAVTGVAAVMDGARERFTFEHVESQDGGRWWVMQVVRLKDADRGAVVTYAEITERRRAELDAQRSREELAHVGRVSTMGALVLSLAHQLNQPLAAIMANAQAAHHLLDRPPVDLSELRTILGEVVTDDRRAAEVIRRLRELLRKSSADNHGVVDLAAAIKDVATLVHSDAVIRNVAVTLDCERGEGLLVHGDRIQIQQVVLNLLVNALEAMTDASGAERTIRVMCLPHGNLARVMVSDSGVGFDAGTEELVFEPFYTTKLGGMGMGLSIARSIVEAHGGRITIHRECQPGTTVEFTLPLASENLHPQ